MPTYQYACTECGERLEVVQKFSDDPLTTCPACEGRLRKIFSAVGVVFKGSGFYRTDSRTASAGASASGPDKSGDKTGDKPGDKTGDKPGDKSSTKAEPAKAASGAPAGKAESAA